MNVGQSIKIGLAERNRTQMWLADELGVSSALVSRMCKRRANVSGEMIEKIAHIMNLKSSEFIALGEQEITMDQ